MEPYARTLREIGRLCMAWSHLEVRTEATVWGVLDLNATTGPLISWKQDLRGKWALICDFSSKKHSEEDQAELRLINKDIKTVSADRNIIVHGAVHSRLAVTTNLKSGDTIPGGNNPIFPFLYKPCWTVFKGEGKGKSYPVSTEAVRLVIDNISKLANRVQAFNKQHGYVPNADYITGIYEENWPEPLG